MCLLIALFQVVADAPLIVAANRDERYARPAVAMTTLRRQGPRILGGRDELAGGTWLAVNEHGLIAGLTNQPSPAGRDVTKRSRGEIPLAFAAYRNAAEAVTAVCAKLDPVDYNPCWLLVGDRHRLFSIGLAGEGAHPDVEELAPGVHILENAPLRARSAKTAQVARLVAAQRAARAAGAACGLGAGEDLATAADALAAVLSDHRPAAGLAVPARSPAISAACVHTPEYGTRSALIATITAAGPPLLRVADGSPCVVPFRDATGLWADPALA
ncbi:MAG TPA: NRDE family protein [Streptosporangiaceae bacterium]|nr:NRDE family protein [Streptosporangiaceae bacterium]